MTRPCEEALTEARERIAELEAEQDTRREHLITCQQLTAQVTDLEAKLTALALERDEWAAAFVRERNEIMRLRARR